MRLIESNHRYSLYKQGFHTILEFKRRSYTDRSKYNAIYNALTKHFGVAYDRDQPDLDLRYNKVWRNEVNHKRGWMRIYLNDEATLTYLCLVENITL